MGWIPDGANSCTGRRLPRSTSAPACFYLGPALKVNLERSLRSFIPLLHESWLHPVEGLTPGLATKSMKPIWGHGPFAWSQEPASKPRGCIEKWFANGLSLVLDQAGETARPATWADINSPCRGELPHPGVTFFVDVDVHQTNLDYLGSHSQPRSLVVPMTDRGPKQRPVNPAKTNTDHRRACSPGWERW